MALAYKRTCIYHGQIWTELIELNAAKGKHKNTWQRVLANGGIFPGIFLGISVEMVLAGLREGYPWNSQEYRSLKPASTISTDIPRNIPENIPPLARALRVLANVEIFPRIFLEISMENGVGWLERWIVHESLSDIPETLRNIYLWSQPMPFPIDIPRDIPGKIPMVTRALSM